jgi:Arc/MetJ-type ribon-helix-helix transcriptional regulator
MPAHKGKTEFYKSASVPADDYNLIKKWVESGKSPYVSVDEAYRDAIRNILYGRWPELPT